MRITADMLIERGACESEAERFLEVWPRGALVRRATLMKAVRLGFDIRWFAEHCLSAPMWREFDRADTAASDEYNKIGHASFARMGKRLASTLTERAEDDVRAKHTHTMDVAWARYEKAHADALWAALQADKAKGRGLWAQDAQQGEGAN